MRNLLQRYRGISLVSRLLILASVAVLSAAISFADTLPILPVVGVLVAAGIMLDTVVRQPRLVLAVGIAAVQLLAAYQIAATIFVGTIGQVGTSSATAYGYATMSILTTLLLVHAWLSVTVLRGRVWLNLAALAIITDGAFLVFVSALGSQGFPFALVWGLTILLGGIYALLRSLRFRRTTAPEPYQFSRGKLDQAARQLASMGLQVEEVEDGSVLKLVASKDGISRSSRLIYAILPISSKQDIDYGSTGLQVDGVDQTARLEVFLREVRLWRRGQRLPAARVLPVVWNVQGSPVWATRARLYARQRPDVALGQVFLVNNAGFRWLLGHAGSVPKRLRRGRPVGA